MPANLENSAVATGLGKSVFIPIPKKGNNKECSSYHTIALISHTSKVMLKILQARLQQYVNQELTDVQFGFRKDRGNRSSCQHLLDHKREFQTNTYFCFIDHAKAFDCMNHDKLWKILQEMGIPDQFTCLMRNLYAGQEEIGSTIHGTMDWFQIRKGVCQGCILSPCLFNTCRVHHVKCWARWSISWNKKCQEKYQ